MRNSLFFALALGLLFWVGCAEDDTPVNSIPGHGQLVFKVGSVPSIVSSIEADITNSSTGDVINVDLTSNTIVSLMVGDYSVDVRAYDANGNAVYRGSADFTVVEGQNTIASITMDPVTGTVQFEFVWGDGE
jgi:hypothetical protein